MKFNTLKDAVEFVVTGFESQNKTFSIFEITQDLRKLANAKAFTLGDRLTEPFPDNGVLVHGYKINHQEVRGCFDELIEDNVFKVTKKFNGQYIEYSFDLPTLSISNNVTTTSSSNKMIILGDEKTLLPQFEAKLLNTAPLKGKFAIKYKGTMFISSSGKCLWQRKSNASAEFCKHFFGPSPELTTRLGVSCGETTTQFKKRVLKMLKNKGELEFVEN